LPPFGFELVTKKLMFAAGLCARAEATAIPTTAAVAATVFLLIIASSSLVSAL
jgi:hypothetical protein